MDLHVLVIVLFLQCVDVIHMQTITGPSETAVVRGEDGVLSCSVTGVTSPVFVWNDESVSPTATIYTGGGRLSQDAKYDNFMLDESVAETSTLTITSAAIEDEGSYVCAANVAGPAPAAAVVTVEVASSRSLIISSRCIAGFICTAVCNAVGGRPQETMQWYNGTIELTPDNIMSQPNPDDPDLTDTRSEYTFIGSSSNNGSVLECRIGGHAATGLNGSEIREILVYDPYPPAADAIVASFSSSTREVSCRVVKQPIPEITIFYIYQNDDLIFQNASFAGDEIKFQLDALPAIITNFTCTAGNYLGNATDTTLYVPNSPTTDPPTTPGTTEDPGNPSPSPKATTTPVAGDDPSKQTGPYLTGIIVGAVLGGLAAAILIGVLIYFLFKKGYIVCRCPSRASTTSNANKVTAKAAGPKAAPRNIEHLNDNPEGAEYAMVSKPPGGGGGAKGDVTDAPRKPQGQPQDQDGLTYAHLDLSTGHTTEHVPQNKNDVVVYSSILV